MKITYIAILPDLVSNLGVLKKIKEQTLTMVSDIVEVEVAIFYKDESELLLRNEFPPYFNFIKYPYYGYNRPLQLMNLWKKIQNVVRKNEYGVVYFRYPGASYFLFNLLKNNKNKIVLEHNTLELEEFKLRAKFPLLAEWKEKFYAKKSFKYALGNVGKASEFSAHQESKVGYKLNVKTITNGVNVKNITLKDTITLQPEEKINLIFVGNTSIWHGLERLFEGIKNYNNQHDYCLYLVGNEKIFLELISKFGLEDLLNKTIILTGFKTGDELNQLHNRAHFAIGSLGLHRINIYNGVPLKHREYLSKGLPFVYAGKDEDIDDSLSDYLFNIAPNETPIDFLNLMNFITELYENNEDISEKLRQYAINNVDMSIKSSELISFLEDTLTKLNDTSN